MTRIRVSDWVGINCGDIVHEHDNPRHLGRVEAVHNSATVKVRWLDSNPKKLVSYLPLAAVVVVSSAPRSDAEISLPARASMPKPELAKGQAAVAAYYAESPKRALKRYFREQRGKK